MNYCPLGFKLTIGSDFLLQRGKIFKLLCFSTHMISRAIVVIHDTDLHGLSCGVNALYSLGSATPFSHFDPRSDMRTTPDNLANVIQKFGNVDLYILDIPIDVRNPKAYIDALISHTFKGRVIWMDHHGHSQWVDVLNRSGVIAVVYGSSYDLSMALPRMYNRVDKFTEEWALLGALADFDSSIATKVSREFEEIVCDIVDSVYKQQRSQLMQILGIREEVQFGNIGSLAKGIVEKGVEVSQFIEACKQIGKPIQVPQYNVLNNVVYTTQLPQVGLSWKTAWKLCCITGSKVAIVPAYNPARNEYSIIIATYWRESDEVRQIVEDFIRSKFSARTTVGHFGAKSIVLFSQSEIETIPQIAKELDELIQQRAYTPRVARLISDEYVAKAIVDDFKAILRRLTELIETQQKMYQEYLELKRRQVELLEKASEEEKRRYD